MSVRAEMAEKNLIKEMKSVMDGIGAEISRIVDEEKDRLHIVMFKNQFPRTYYHVEQNVTPQCRCNRCGMPVLTETEVENYPYVCVRCDENLYGIETYTTEAPMTDAEKAKLLSCALVLGLEGRV